MRPSEKDTRRFLRSYQDSVLKLDALEDELEMVKAHAMSMSADMSGGASPCGVSDKVGKGALELAEIEQRICDQIRRLKNARDAVWDVVEEVESRNIIWGRCLHYRYIRGYKPFVAALEMKYEPNSERRIHARAVRCVSELLEGRPELLQRALGR